MNNTLKLIIVDILLINIQLWPIISEKLLNLMIKNYI